MKIRFLYVLILIVFGLVGGYVWSDHIITFVRAIFSTEPASHYEKLPFDGWLT